MSTRENSSVNCLVPAMLSHVLLKLLHYSVVPINTSCCHFKLKSPLTFQCTETFTFTVKQLWKHVVKNNKKTLTRKVSNVNLNVVTAIFSQNTLG